MIVTAWNNGSYHESGAGYVLKIMAQTETKHSIENGIMLF